MKIIGLMLTWNNLEFFKCALQQALDFCDEVYVVDGCHSRKYLWHSTDGTYEYLKAFKHNKLKFVDIKRHGDRYDRVQRFLRDTVPKKSRYWQPGNWVFQLDDDLFLFRKDWAKIERVIHSTESHALSFMVRYFIYNFQINFLQAGGSVCYKILDDFEMKGIGYPHYKNGRKFRILYLGDIVAHHYTYVKKPGRMKARWEMSIEKGTRSSIGRFEKWVNTEWLSADSLAQLEKELSKIRPGGGLNIYVGKHPEALDDHPWLDVADVRVLK